ncbi:polyphosphate polymerase domain-containing protein [Sediminitomix flava]|uniref:VTC domain-containing protein n=1 Tax=Sediminitomix flava TaxID=379075 RepID=A0A315ZIM2_SEDFL|nr:polyphosphate polymerase domain-containing protein [Sediminitomix flava]PWJ45063.1 VTC domain-containing protein [Sediminitomix flava]
MVLPTYSHLINQYESISLEEIQAVKLMNRVDQKFLLTARQLTELLRLLSEDYYVMEIENKRLLQYQTHYFDTKEDAMYQNHQRGKLNRFKIRHRTYVDSEVAFLELKFKNNKGRTEKIRIPSATAHGDFSKKESYYLANHSPYKAHELSLKLKNNFQRITLANKDFTERCTIDVELNFTNTLGTESLGGLSIVEVKTDQQNQKAIILNALKKLGIRPSRFSKYCIGRALLEPHLKANRFKRRILKLNTLL